MRVEAYIQARMGSTRLPGKVLKKVQGRPLLDYLIERVKQSKEIDDIAILTTNLAADDQIDHFCQERKIRCFRGPEADVLERYYEAALRWKPDAVVRITSDCPLVDPEIVDEVVAKFKKDYPFVDYVSNTLERTYPRGLDVEVMSFNALERCASEAQRPEEREHVTLYLYRHPDRFKLENLSLSPPAPSYRWTVDTPEDFALVRLLLESIYPQNPRFRLHDILQLLSLHPEWILLNAHIEQKPISD